MADDVALPDLVLPRKGRDHTLGAPEGRHTLIEYGDYENPHCAHLRPVVKELLDELGSALYFAYRHYPDPKSHPNAQHAAEGAEAAGMQAKFWLMHDRLFHQQTDLGPSEVRRIAEEISLDMPTFDRDLRSGAAARLVAEDIESGDANGVGATPVMFVDGKLHVGLYEFVPLLRALQGPSAG